MGRTQKKQTNKQTKTKQNKKYNQSNKNTRKGFLPVPATILPTVVKYWISSAGGAARPVTQTRTTGRA